MCFNLQCNNVARQVEGKCYPYYRTLSQNKTQKHTRKLTTSVSISYYSFPVRDWSLVFNPEKPTFSVSSDHKTTYKRPGWYSLPYSLPSLWKIRARESLNSHHLITQRDNIHARAPDMCVNPGGYMTSGWRNFVLKIEKLSHIIGARESRVLRSPSPIMAPAWSYSETCKSQYIMLCCCQKTLNFLTGQTEVGLIYTFIGDLQQGQQKNLLFIYQISQPRPQGFKERRCRLHNSPNNELYKK